MHPLPLAGLLTLLTLTARAAEGRGEEEVILVQLLDNGDFAEPGPNPASGRIPWWSIEGRAHLVHEEGRTRLFLEGGARARQPLPAYAPLAEGLLLRGNLEGRGSLLLRDGRGGEASFELEPGPFEITGADLVRSLGSPLEPRFELLLVAGPGGAQWSSLSAAVPFPRADPADLAAEIEEHLEFILGVWFAHGLEPPERDTGFIHHLFDAVTGEPLTLLPGGTFPLWDELLRVPHLERHPRWQARFERFLSAYFEHAFHPKTALPRRWDSVAGRPLDEAWIEPRGDLMFLLDLVERGPESLRGPALERARAMGETILRVGVLPDGNVAARYRAADAAVSLDALPLRRLDIPAQFARLGRATGDERYLVVARNALAEFEFTHYWPGNWEHIDPGFDDDFGIYGTRALTMLDAYPGEPAFRAVLASGQAYYAPRWRDAVRLGGTVAADQVRCWRLLLGYARHDEASWAALVETLPAALRGHLKGTQYGNGAWGDVTSAGFDPQPGLRVGDLPGTPSNLLQGIALCYGEPRLGLDPAELRALYRAVLRSTDRQYRRPYGYLYTEREHAGHNQAGGGLRLLPGLVEMLGHLE